MYTYLSIFNSLSRIVTFNWVKRPFSRMGVVTLNRAHNKNRPDRGKKNIFLDSPFANHLTDIILLVYHEYRLL